MDDSSNIPLKRCTRCENEKPQTREFFRPTRGGGYYPYCKACASNKTPEEPVPEGFKRCSLCRQEKPMTSQFFKPTNHKQFFPYCRECGSSVEKPTQVQAGYKRCIQCRTAKPAAKEFFASSPISKDGLKRQCRSCSGEEECAVIVPVGYKKCTFCKQVKPETTEYFHRWKGHLRSCCKTCQNARDRERSHQETLEKQAIRALNAPPPGMKRCSRCHEIKPADALHFHRRALVKNCGLEGECKICKSKRAKEYTLKNADKVQWQKFMYKEANREVIRAQGRAYARAHRSESNARYRYRQELMKRNGGDYTARDVQDQLNKQHSECYWCHQHLYEYHVDHVIPISKGGSNGPENIVLACPFCNLSKGDKTIEEWLVYLEKFILPRKRA